MSDENMIPDEAEYHVLMPFVACASNGGPLDDHAFVGGFTCGAIDVELAHGIAPARYVHTDVVPQLDLIAMKHGYAMTSEPWDQDPTQSLVVFEKEI